MAAAPPTPTSGARASGGGHHTPAAAARPGGSADSAAASTRARARWSLLMPGAKAYRLERLLRHRSAAEWAIQHQAAYRGFRCLFRLLSGRGRARQHAWLPFSLSKVLHPHQREGVRWLYRRSAQKYRPVCLWRQQTTRSIETRDVINTYTYCRLFILSFRNAVQLLAGLSRSRPRRVGRCRAVGAPPRRAPRARRPSRVGAAGPRAAGQGYTFPGI